MIHPWPFIKMNGLSCSDMIVNQDFKKYCLISTSKLHAPKLLMNNLTAEKDSGAG